MKPTTTTTPDTTIETPVIAAPKKPQQTTTITLTAGGSVMQIVAQRLADGTASTYVTTMDESKKSTRGMTEKHTSFEAARTAIAARATQAEKLGWARRAAAKGFTARPDAFSALPTAPKAAPVVKTPKLKK